MKIYKKTTPHSTSLLLLFAGWSARPELFARLEAEEGMDVMIVYDYRDTTFTEDLSKYTSIRLIAWSMGVRMAEILLDNKYHFVEAIAINGTGRPIDDSYGIPIEIFRGTLEGFSSEGLHRFNRRMCGSRDILKCYAAIPPRPLDELKEELQQIYNRCFPYPDSAEAQPAGTILWTRAIISTDDRIFPAAAQRNYWQGRCPNVDEIVSPHYPFFLWKRWNEL